MSNYWLFKSEPSTFHIQDLKDCDGSRDHWDGVRNYQARNFMKEMKKGDLGFFYHSSCKVPAIVGMVKIVKEAYPDHTAFDKKSNYYDPKSTPDVPRWFMVDVKFMEEFSAPITLQELKANPKLEGFPLLAKGNRLSILPVEKSFVKNILGMLE